MHKLLSIVLMSFVAGLVAACGGGGSTPVPVAKAPTVNISLATAKVAANTPLTISWVATDATSCFGSDALPNVQPVNGTASVTQTSGGEYTYTITCTGAGGSATAKAISIVPIPVQKTSHLNAKNLNIPAQKYPKFPLGPDGMLLDRAGAGVAYADFFQEGKISMVWFTNRPPDAFSPNPTGVVKFYKFDAAGNPIEYTSSVLADTKGCAAPRKLLVADFNGDGKPDVFASCHGPEYPNGLLNPGEAVRVLLSQPDGTYKNVELPLTCYCHTATAADINGDGTVDILTSDARVGNSGSNVYTDITSFVALLNDGKGNFTVQRNYTKVLPELLTNGQGVNARTNTWTMELVDVNNDGQADLIIGSVFDYGGTWGVPYPSRVILNHNGVFDEIAFLINVDLFQFCALDIVVKDRNIYLYGPINNEVAYVSLLVYKYNMDTKVGSKIYDSNGTQWPNASISNDFVWVMPYNGNIVPYDAAFGIAIPM